MDALRCMCSPGLLIEEQLKGVGFSGGGVNGWMWQHREGAGLGNMGLCKFRDLDKLTIWHSLIESYMCEDLLLRSRPSRSSVNKAVASLDNLSLSRNKG